MVDWLVGGFYLKSQPFGPTGTGGNVLSPTTTSLDAFNYSFYEEESKALFANANVALDTVPTGCGCDVLPFSAFTISL